LKVRGKKLTRKQKEALSAQGWDFRLYLCGPGGGGGAGGGGGGPRAAGKYIMFKK